MALTIKQTGELGHIIAYDTGAPALISLRALEGGCVISIERHPQLGDMAAAFAGLNDAQLPPAAAAQIAALFDAAESLPPLLS